MAPLAGGGYAERGAVNERLCLPIPERMSFEDAAAVPEAFLTASEALFGLGELCPGEWVLVHAAGSGVGTAALQLARAVGARVVATTSDAKVDRVLTLRPERVVAREREDFAAVVAELTGGAGVELILDLVGASYLEQNQRSLAQLGRHVVIGLVGGAKAEIDLARLLSRRQSLLGMVMRTRSLADKIRVVERFRREQFARLEKGELRPIVDSVLPLAEAARAHAQMEANESFGKIVLGVSE
jgi:NADPH:quinone reductase-like Zn-dependent oxidoreductase